MSKNWIFIGVTAAVISLVGCKNTDDGGTLPPPPPAAIQFVDLVRQVFASTNETSAPLPINDLELDTSDETPTLFDFLLI